MSRYLTLLLCTIILVAGCSRTPEGSATALPTAPSLRLRSGQASAAPGSLVGPTAVAPGGVSGKFDVSFPGRNESFDFRNQLEAKYQTTLGRSPSPTFVDGEGEVVWTQEYMRYRVNGCDHAGATERVLVQVDGQPAGRQCGAPGDGLIVFPPRTDAFDFRRQLEAKYQQFGRGLSQSTVDAEGGVIWTQEYLRYRVNQCDHPTSTQKVFAQIDGGGVAATCYVPPCVFAVSPSVQNVTASGGTFTATITKTSGEDCEFRAETLDPFVSLIGGTSGSATTTTLTYFVPPNFGGARATSIRVRWTNNSTVLDIYQAAGNTAAFTLTDPLNALGTTTTCLIRSTSTPCTFNVIGAGFSANATYSWAITYQYGGTITHHFTSSEPRFTFTQTCGGPGATATGLEVPLEVILVITDGNTSVTAQSGFGGQPPMSLRFFSC